MNTENYKQYKIRKHWQIKIVETILMKERVDLFN